MLPQLEVTCDFIEIERGQWYCVFGDWEANQEGCVAYGPFPDYGDAADFIPGSPISWRIMDIDEGFDAMDLEPFPELTALVESAKPPTAKLAIDQLPKYI